MKRKSYTEEQIIGIWKEHEAGMYASELIPKHGIANSTFYRWMARYGGLEIAAAKRLRELEAENAKLKKRLADTILGKSGVGGCGSPKVVRPAARRRVVGHLRVQFALSVRRACRLAGISHQALSYQPKDQGDDELRARLKALGEQYPRYGYLLLHAMLKNDGLGCNRKRT